MPGGVHWAEAATAMVDRAMMMENMLTMGVPQKLQDVRERSLRSCERLRRYIDLLVDQNKRNGADVRT